jgi:hypothetical protein
LCSLTHFWSWVKHSIYSEQNLCQNQNSAWFWAERENQKISWQHILIIFPIISRQDYLILVLQEQLPKSNLGNDGEIVKPKLDYVPEYVFAFLICA